MIVTSIISVLGSSLSCVFPKYGFLLAMRLVLGALQRPSTRLESLYFFLFFLHAQRACDNLPPQESVLASRRWPVRSSSTRMSLAKNVASLEPFSNCPSRSGFSFRISLATRSSEFAGIGNSCSSLALCPRGGFSSLRCYSWMNLRSGNVEWYVSMFGTGE